MLPNSGTGTTFRLGAHHNRDQPTVPSYPIFLLVLGHYFHPLIFSTKKKLLTSEAFCLSLQLSEESTFAAASNKGLSAKWAAEPMKEGDISLKCFFCFFKVFQNFRKIVLLGQVKARIGLIMLIKVGLG